MVVHAIMTNSDVASVVGAASWSDEGSYVREVITQAKLPLLAKVLKGQYLSIGVPSLANPSLSSTVLISSAGKSTRVAAQSVKFKDGRRVVPVGPKFAIPDSFEGYFEILSEDGKAVKCIESVAEMSKRFPDSCLVRETIKAYVSKSDDIESITEKSRLIQSGETLILIGDVIGSKNGRVNKFLRCFDQAGQNIYLTHETRGKFSAIAKEDNISGVHSIRNLLNKRLPLMVRLINGCSPIGTKSNFNFIPELRLFGMFTEEPLAALPLGKDAPMTIIPPTTQIKLAPVKNIDQIEKTKEFLRICDKASSILNDISDRITVYDVAIRGSKNSLGSKDPRFAYIDATKSRNWYNNGKTQRSKSTPVSPGYIKGVNNYNKSGKDEYDEIDQIYDYVRGFAPLPKHIKSPYATQDDPPIRRSVSTEVKPSPPPLETIPNRKSSEPKPKLKENLITPSIHPALISAALEKAEGKVEFTNNNQHPVLSRQINQINQMHPNNKNMKMFVKSNNNKSSRFHIINRQKSSSPNKDQNLTNSQSNLADNSPSSIFRIRYKSLTNLAMNEDTLKSGTSCGKNSADSSGSVGVKLRQPEKKSRKLLMRPKSLTNLVWGDGYDRNSNSSGLIPNPPDLLEGNVKIVGEMERRMRLEPGVYRHGRDAPALIAATTKLLASKKIGTLYI